MPTFKNQHTISEFEVHFYSFFHIVNKKRLFLKDKKKLLYFCIFLPATAKSCFFQNLQMWQSEGLIIVSDVLTFGLRVYFQCRAVLSE